ncbi:CCA tRNA nucleotidyltransferase [Prochlorococcus marinus XMU1414]|uniref:CCA tRNA nucleotidyltransferase n=1 Tax=Prochlorococcus marinus XMU1424 TaxID=2774497 RepID=A0A9D9BZP3_PROMR|nr:CCA tRNA nucleotidyltransferase [Prochlorococcus marinus]MBO8227439.1 CCA tRNA nucleotidyltransferase [Prochlorococcus marinus XMU1414]MBW3044953.1 CCA tRNA nucleotidyltransferase [Prochlorococcus marinus str. MU1414]MCR8532782.1 CCA tRNA nucleotidyltransferase [Prochlorococcus marinus XMU1420]MCR8536686.1 CCA tRNA nucleotidyltransferase [Prochlorococcus marinus XMU1424]
MKNSFYTDHTLIIDELETSIKFHNLDLILGFLPKGSYLVGGYIRDIILGRKTEKLDVDIVVPLNAIEIGKKIANNIGSKFIILDKKREVVRIILNNIYIDIANQVSSSIEGDLCSRDFSINSIAFLFDEKSLFDPLNGLKDLEISLLRTHSEKNLLNDPLRILRCFRFVSELNFKIDLRLIDFIKKNKGNLYLVAKERITYEIKKIVNGANALDAILLIKKLNIFDTENLFEDSFFLDLEKINYGELDQEEKDKYLPSFFIAQILDVVTLEKLNFSKADIANTKLLRKWHLFLKNKNIAQLDEFDRFKLHQELEMVLPSFMFYLPENLQLDWLHRWRDNDDKLFHPSHLVNGDVIKKNLEIKDGPILGELLQYLSKELAYKRLNNFDEAIYKAKRWIEQNAPKCD